MIMKVVFKILAIFILLTGCVTTKHVEGELVLTKAYCGKAVSVNYDGKTSVIQTTLLTFKVKGNLDVPKGAYCYIRREICRVDATKSMKMKLEPKYFSWNNSEEYRIKGNIPYKLFNIK